MTDIEGSTALWERNPQSMAKALARHDQLIAAVVDEHEGQLVKSMGEGDSTFSVFTDPIQAIEASVAIARALAVEPWPDASPIRIRMGVHTGDAERRDGDYFGPTINLAARVRGESRGGEVLASSATAAAVREQLPDGFRLVDLGPHRLKGIGDAERLYALEGPGLEVATPESPYRGLLAFEPADRGLFFGRDDVVSDLLTRIEAGNLLAVVGPSGSGKSSVLRAGVVGAVRAGELSGLTDAVVIAPGPDPPLDLNVEAATLLVVDQFEEIYTQCQDREQRVRFIEQILAYSGPVAIAVRADFYGELSSHPALARAVSENQVLLGPMTDEQLRSAVIDPARVAGLQLESGLADIVLAELSGEPGALPLMSHALRATWERREGRTLTIAAYRETGGVSSALSETADNLVAALPEADRPLLRNILLRLVELGDGVEFTRRRVATSELVPKDGSAAKVDMLLQQLADARLITLGDGTAEIAHEVLIRSWPALRQWLSEDREGLRLHRRLGDTARLWEASGGEPGDLYRGARLEAAVEWADTNPDLLNEAERTFLNASVAAATRAQRAQIRVNRRLRWLAGGIGVLLLAATGLLVFSLISRGKAVDAERTAKAQALAAESRTQQSVDSERALLLAIAAVQTKAIPETIFALRAAIDDSTIRERLPSVAAQGCGGPGIAYDPAPVSKVLAESLCDGTVRLVDAASGAVTQAMRLPSPQQTTIKYAATGTTLLVAAGDRVVALDARSGAVTSRSPLVRGLATFAVSPHSPKVAILGKDQLDFWDTQTDRIVTTRPKILMSYERREVAQKEPARPNRLAYSPDGRRLALTFESNEPPDPAVVLYDINRRRIVATSSPRLLGASGLAFSPDGSSIAVGRLTLAGGEISMLDARTLAFDKGFTPTKSAFDNPMALAFSPDGKELAYGFATGASGVVSAVTGEAVDSYPGSTAAIWNVSFNPDGTLVATGSLDGTLREWRGQGLELHGYQLPDVTQEVDTDVGGFETLASPLATPGPGAVIQQYDLTGRPEGPPLVLSRTAPVDDGFLAPDGKFAGVLTSRPGSSLTTLRVWDVAARDVVHTVRLTNGQSPLGPGMSSDGRYIGLTTTAAPTPKINQLVLLDTTTGRVRVLARTKCGEGWTGFSFSHSDALFAAGTFCGRSAVWDTSSGHQVGKWLNLGGQLSSSSFSPSGDHVTFASWDSAIKVSPVPVTGAAVTLTDNTSGVVEVAYSPDGRYLASAGLDSTVRIYDALSLNELRVIVQPKPVVQVSFTSDSNDVLGVDLPHDAWLWDACGSCEDPAALLALARSRVTRSLTPQERQEFGIP